MDIQTDKKLHIMEYKEKAIRGIVASFVKAYAAGFSDRHISEKDDEDGVINMKIHNVFIAALGSEIQYYSALARLIVHLGLVDILLNYNWRIINQIISI
jgi:hypothetical protein